MKVGTLISLCIGWVFMLCCRTIIVYLYRLKLANKHRCTYDVYYKDTLSTALKKFFGVKGFKVLFFVIRALSVILGIICIAIEVCVLMLNNTEYGEYLRVYI